MERKNLDKNVEAFSSFINRVTIIQFWVSLAVVSILIISYLFLEFFKSKLVITGLGIVAVFLLLESVYLMVIPYNFTNKYGSCLSDITHLNTVLSNNLKLYGAIFSGGIIFALVCICMGGMKAYIPIAIPIIFLGAWQLVKTQILLYRSWILEDEFNRMS